MPKPGTRGGSPFSEKTDWKCLFENPLMESILPRQVPLMQEQIAILRKKGVETSPLERAWAAELGWARSQWLELGEAKPLEVYRNEARKMMQDIDDFDPQTLSTAQAHQRGAAAQVRRRGCR